MSEILTDVLTLIAVFIISTALGVLGLIVMGL